jgi:hypothetical protein
MFDQIMTEEDHRRWQAHLDASEEYIQQILDSARPGMSREQFQAHCRPDRNAGYVVESDEAERRYFQ